MTERLREQLLASWAAVMPHAMALGEDLVNRWSEPHRTYHDLRHLDESLSALRDAGGGTRPERLAIWFHDAIHSCTPGEDERASAKLARELLPSADLDTTEANEVARLVLLTIDHTPAEDDRSGAKVCDADLAILGASPQRYDASIRDLRAEQPDLDPSRWRLQRIAVVRRLLAADPLFHSGAGRRLWAQQAQINLEAELASLQLIG